MTPFALPAALSAGRSLVLTLALLLPMGLVMAADPPKPSAGADAAEKAIRETAAAFAAAFNRADAAAVAALWTPQGTLANDRGELLSGRQAIEAQYRSYFESSPGAHLEITIERIELLTPDVALEDGIAVVDGLADEPPSAGRYTVVHHRQGNQWQMAAVRESRIDFAQAEVGLEDLEWLLGTWQVETGDRKVTLSFEWAENQSFLTGTHRVEEQGQLVSEGKQVIGWDAADGVIAVWVFNSDGGHAQGTWMPHAEGWQVQLTGVTGDGVPTQAVNMFTRQGDNLVWQSVRRLAGGMPLPDTEKVVLQHPKK